MTGLEAHETVAVVDPRTGVIFKAEDVTDELLVEIFTELERREKQTQEWRRAAEDELVRRHGDRRAAQVIGHHEVDIDRAYSRVWDVEDLALVLRDLAATGRIKLSDIDGVIVKQDEYKVDGRKAAALLSRLEKNADQLNRDGDMALTELRRCFTWKQGRARVRVTPVAEIEP
jgi:hypothetical protein